MKRPIHRVRSTSRAVGSPSPAARAPVGSEGSAAREANAATVRTTLPFRPSDPATRHAREPIDIPTELRELFQTGKLEQTCRGCGRWEAAGWSCSWCASPTGPADWYRNGLVEQREARMPKAAPANPPDEYRHSLSQWPAAWGRWPGVPRQEALRDAGTLDNPPETPKSAHVPVEPEQLALAVSVN